MGQEGQVRDAAVLLAIGVDQTGKRQIVGISIPLGEQEAHWRAFLQSLVGRGLRGVQLIISDAHAGLQAARQAVFGGIAWQRCQFHLQQNAQAYVPKRSLRSQVAADIRTIFNAPDQASAEAYLREYVAKYQDQASKLADWMETNLPQGLTVLAFPSSHQRRIGTVNVVERLNQEFRRRTRVVNIFPNQASCLRFISAIAMESSEAWQTGRRYVSFEGTDMIMSSSL